MAVITERSIGLTPCTPVPGRGRFARHKTGAVHLTVDVFGIYRASVAPWPDERDVFPATHRVSGFPSPCIRHTLHPSTGCCIMSAMPTALHSQKAPAVGNLDDRKQRGLIHRRSSRALGLLVALAALVLVGFCSIAVGTKPISFGTVLDSLFHYDSTLNDHVIVRSLRVPRTIVGLLVGVALGLVRRGDAGRGPQPAGRSRASSASTPAPRCSSSSPSTASASPACSATSGSPSPAPRSCRSSSTPSDRSVARARRR